MNSRVIFFLPVIYFFLASCDGLRSGTANNQNDDRVELGLKAADLIYGRSDVCLEDEIIGVVRENTDCLDFSVDEVAWSIKVDGECVNIADTNARQACFHIQSKSADAIYGRTDSCDRDRVIGAVRPDTNCDIFSDSGVAWSIKVDGQCVNITDTTPRRACAQVQSYGPNVIYGRSDSCATDKALGAVHPDTDCNRFSQSQDSWSIKADGQCINISDTNARRACIQVQGEGPNVVYGRSDSCARDKALGAVGKKTNCNDFDSNQVAWSIRVEGDCINIVDTTAPRACSQVQASGPNVVYGRSDSCALDKAIGAVHPETNCQLFSSTDAAWSIKVDGVCENISDTNARRACAQVQSYGPDVVYGRSDSCAQDKAIGAVHYTTDCNQFSDSEAAWSIKVDGVCENISDTNARRACVLVQTN